MLGNGEIHDAAPCSVWGGCVGSCPVTLWAFWGPLQHLQWDQKSTEVPMAVGGPGQSHEQHPVYLPHQTPGMNFCLAEIQPSGQRTAQQRASPAGSSHWMPESCLSPMGTSCFLPPTWRWPLALPSPTKPSARSAALARGPGTVFNKKGPQGWDTSCGRALLGVHSCSPAVEAESWVQPLLFLLFTTREQCCWGVER